MSVSQSPTVANLAAALVKAQRAMKAAAKGSTNPFFNSKYADLGAVWEACREALQANGLSVVQLPGYEPGAIRLTTILLHESGEWISGEAGAPIPSKEKKQKDGTTVTLPPDAQSAGSAITYLRRYALAAVAGVVTEDDDGNSASGNAPQRPASASRGRGATPERPVGDRAKSPLQTPQAHGANPDLSKMPDALAKPEEPLPWEPGAVASEGEREMVVTALKAAGIEKLRLFYRHTFNRPYEKLYKADVQPLIDAAAGFRDLVGTAGGAHSHAGTGPKETVSAAPSPTSRTPETPQ